MRSVASSVYAFKNGVCLVAETFELESSSVESEWRPQLGASGCSGFVHGSVWLEGERVKSVVSAPIFRSTPPSLPDLLVAHHGLPVDLLLASGSWVQGVLSASDQSSLCSLKLPDGRCHFFLSSDVSQMRLDSAHLVSLKSTQVKTDQSSLVVRLAPDTAGSSNVLSIRYIVKNSITFAPSYKIVLEPESEKTLRISGQAVVMNDGLDVERVTSLNLLAGVPELAFTHVADPLLSGNMQQFLSQLSNRPSSSFAGGRGMQGQQMVMSNMISQQVMMPPSSAGAGGEEADTNAQDLHVYSYSDVSLALGSRAVVPLFKETLLSFEDVHEAEIQLEAHPAHRNAQDGLIDVYHSIVFKNGTGAPFTTGPVLVTRGADQQLVCQGTMFFSPCGSEVKVKLTKTLNLRMYHEEGSVERTKEKKTVLRNDYQACIASGSVAIHNRTSSACTIRVRATLTGDLVETSAVPISAIETSSTDLVNAHRLVTFEVKLQPGDDQTIRYRRKYFLHA